MKKTDIAMIILIASVSVLIAYFVTNAILGDNVSEPVEVKTIDAVSSTVGTPNEDIFNSNAINPTVEVIIGADSDSSQSSQ